MGEDTNDLNMESATSIRTTAWPPTRRQDARMDIAGARIELYERTLRDLRDERYRNAALGIRRLLMLLPPDHFARGDLLHVLGYAEAAASARDRQTA